MRDCATKRRLYQDAQIHSSQAAGESAIVDQLTSIVSKLDNFEGVISMILSMVHQSSASCVYNDWANTPWFVDEAYASQPHMDAPSQFSVAPDAAAFNASATMFVPISSASRGLFRGDFRCLEEDGWSKIYAKFDRRNCDGDHANAMQSRSHVATEMVADVIGTESPARKCTSTTGDQTQLGQGEQENASGMPIQANETNGKVSIVVSRLEWIQQYLETSSGHIPQHYFHQIVQKVSATCKWLK